jgi:hypothetical protein
VDIFEGGAMRGTTIRRLCLVACFAFAVTASAQEGHPLVGSWHGSWGQNPTTRHDVTLIMDWDGQAITGVVNPGFDQAPILNPVLTISTPTDWNLRFEVDLKDKSGKATHYIVDGKLDNIGFDRRTMSGTWTAGGTKNDFKVTRDRDYSR